MNGPSDGDSGPILVDHAELWSEGGVAIESNAGKLAF